MVQGKFRGKFPSDLTLKANRTTFENSLWDTMIWRKHGEKRRRLGNFPTTVHAFVLKEWWTGKLDDFYLRISVSRQNLEEEKIHSDLILLFLCTRN
jgi:hypothetical protein